MFFYVSGGVSVTSLLYFLYVGRVGMGVYVSFPAAISVCKYLIGKKKVGRK